MNPDRQCKTRDGIPKKAFASFDEAMEAVTLMGENRRRLHTYRCAEHGWHIGHNLPVEVRR